MCVCVCVCVCVCGGGGGGKELIREVMSQERLTYERSRGGGLVKTHWGPK